MKAIGIVRRIDNAGKITLPIQLRRNLNLKKQDSVEIFKEKDYIIIKKYSTNKCLFCGEESETGLIEFKNKKFCLDCFNNIINL